ncbi:MAG: tryptophan--tRNA ligase, partial [Bdellovibrionota bacterium]
IDPERCTLFAQSHVPEHAELAWILMCHSYMGELSRMTQYKDKATREGQNIGAGLFTYPVLMAADIFLYRSNLVPVGEDQKQHVELARDLAIRMGGLLGKELFTVPEVYIPPVGARIMSFQNPTAKMAKSDEDQNGTVYLTDSDDAILKKIKRAVTDSGTEITFDVAAKPGVSNLLTIQSAITGKPIAELVTSYAGKQYGHLKVETAELVVETLRPIRAETERIAEDIPYLDAILARGAEKARAKARPYVQEIYRRLGFVVPKNN